MNLNSSRFSLVAVRVLNSKVFHGMCLGQPVAVKTMLEVTEDNVRAFRDEILLTATLRHPVSVNILHKSYELP
jgi:hypothetical protein